MHRRFLSLALLLIALAVLISRPVPGVPDFTKAGDTPGFEARLPVWFEENRGQAGPEVRYLARTGGATLSLTHSGQAAFRAGATAVTMRLVNARESAPVEGLNPLDARSNYLLGDDPQRWVTGALHFQRVRYAEVYPGIDHIFYGHDRRIEHDFVVAPGADPAQVRMKFDGVRRMRLNPAGDLILETPAGDLIQHRPYAYQPVSAGRLPVPARFELLDGGEIGFEVGRYDRTQPLVIDPIVGGSYLGGSGTDAGFGVGQDVFGNVYLTGLTTSTNFPTASARQSSNGGGPADAYVAKFNPGMSRLIYCTYLGGSNTDQGIRVVADENGNAYVAGATASTNFPGIGAQTPRGGADLFFVKLNDTGQSIVYSTLVGGGNNEIPFALDVDPEGNLFAGGYTLSNNFPTTANAYDASFNGGEDGFVLKLDPSGTLLFSTYLGGAANERVRGISWTTDRKVYVAGTTASSGFPVTSNALQSALRGTSDAFVSRLNAAGTALEFSTFFGGTGTEDVWGLTWGHAEEVAIGGSTSSRDLPAPGGGTQNYAGGDADAFAALLAFPPPAGAPVLRRSATLGSPSADTIFAFGAARSAEGNITDLFFAGREVPSTGSAQGVYLSIFPAPSSAAAFNEVTGPRLSISSYGPLQDTSNWTAAGLITRDSRNTNGLHVGHYNGVLGANSFPEPPAQRFPAPAYQEQPNAGEDAAATLAEINEAFARGVAAQDDFDIRQEAVTERVDPVRFVFNGGNSGRPGERHSFLGAIFGDSDRTVVDRGYGMYYEAYWNAVLNVAPPSQVNRVGRRYGPGPNENKNLFPFSGPNFFFPVGTGKEFGVEIGGLRTTRRVTAPFDFPVKLTSGADGTGFTLFDGSFSIRPNVTLRAGVRYEGPSTLRRCDGFNAALSSNPAATPADRSLFLRYEELFPAVFRTRQQESTPTSTADTGTRLMTRFLDVPSGVQIFVGNYADGFPADTSPLVRTQANQFGGGGFTPVPITSPFSRGISPVPITNGTGQAVFEVRIADPSRAENYEVPVFLAFPPNGAPPGTIRITTSFAPLATGTPSDGAAFPLFDAASAINLSGPTIVNCEGPGAPALATPVNAAGYGRDLAPNSIFTTFSSAITTPNVLFGDGANTTLGDFRLTFDQQGRLYAAPMYSVASGQASGIVPRDLTPGPATLNVLRGGSIIATGPANIVASAPAFFSYDSTGSGAPAGILVTADAAGNQTFTQLTPDGINLNLPGTKVISLFGTGNLGAAYPAGTTFAGGNLRVLFSGPQGQFPAMDQTNIEILPGIIAHLQQQQTNEIPIGNVRPKFRF